MAKITDLFKKYRGQIFLIIIGGTVTAVFTLLTDYFSSKKENENKTSPFVVNNNTSNETRSPSQDTSPEKKQHYYTAEKPVPVKKYVEVYLNINSNDTVLVNGKPAELSEKPNTLKLIAGNQYTIKINNCPEKEIIPTGDMTISVCM